MSPAGIKEQRPWAAAAMLQSRTTAEGRGFTPIQSIIAPAQKGNQHTLSCKAPNYDYAATARRSVTRSPGYLEPPLGPAGRAKAPRLSRHLQRCRLMFRRSI